MDQTQADRVQEITEQLENGIKELFDSQKYEKYLKTMSKLHKYSFNNSLLIAMQKPDATMVAGYTTFKTAFHRNVKKGEKGIRILAPSPYKINKEVEKIDPCTQQPIMGSDGQPLKDYVQVTIPAYKVATVFDVSQTEGDPIPEIASELTDDVNDFERFLHAVKEVSPVPIEMRPIDTGANGYYHLQEKVIVIKEGMSQAQTLKTMIHELSHAMLHDTDNGLEKDSKLDRKTKEVQAESVAYTVCSHYGLDTSDYSFGYVAEWSANKDLTELKDSMETIRSTASEIIKGIDYNLMRIKEEERVNNLASDISRLAKSYDHYGYVDAVDDPEKSIEDIKKDIKKGNIEYLQECFKPIINDKDPIELYDKAKDIIERLNEFSKGKSSEISKKMTTSVSEAVETKDVVKHHHRSH